MQFNQKPLSGAAVWLSRRVVKLPPSSHGIQKAGCAFTSVIFQNCYARHFPSKQLLWTISPLLVVFHSFMLLNLCEVFTAEAQGPITVMSTVFAFSKNNLASSITDGSWHDVQGNILACHSQGRLYKRSWQFLTSPNAFPFQFRLSNRACQLWHCLLSLAMPCNLSEQCTLRSREPPNNQLLLHNKELSECNDVMPMICLCVAGLDNEKNKAMKVPFLSRRIWSSLTGLERTQ